MSELEKIFLTSGLTIFGGVMVFVLGQLINNIFIRPFFKYRNIIGKIDRDLEYYSHIYCNAGENNKLNPLTQETHTELRKDSCDLRAVYQKVSWIKFLANSGLVFNNDAKEKIAQNLIGLSNGLWRLENIEHNLILSEEIKSLINVKNNVKEVVMKNYFGLTGPLSLIILLLLRLVGVNSIIVFCIIALINSFFYGIFAYEIHDAVRPKSVMALYNQFWMNGLFTFVGWLALYYFLYYRLSFFTGNIIYQFQSFDLLVVLVIMLGITGFLPHAIFIGRLFGGK